MEGDRPVGKGLEPTVLVTSTVEIPMRWLGWALSRVVSHEPNAQLVLAMGQVLRSQGERVAVRDAYVVGIGSGMAVEAERRIEDIVEEIQKLPSVGLDGAWADANAW